MVVVSVQVCTAVLLTRSVMDSPPAVPRARTVKLLEPPPELLLELLEELEELLLEDEELLLELEELEELLLEDEELLPPSLTVILELPLL
jgi:hypothetical protein